jgi:hypothetical protein
MPRYLAMLDVLEDGVLSPVAIGATGAGKYP